MTSIVAYMLVLFFVITTLIMVNGRDVTSWGDERSGSYFTTSKHKYAIPLTSRSTKVAFPDVNVMQNTDPLKILMLLFSKGFYEQPNQEYNIESNCSWYKTLQRCERSQLQANVRNIQRRFKSILCNTINKVEERLQHRFNRWVYYRTYITNYHRYYDLSLITDHFG